MEELIKFLGSSTIHGFSHIASSRRCLRVFWIVVVLTCFIIAGGIIQNSVLSWEETPVSTTIETLPITEVTFPLVTVCPPRNRYTNLNYDLVSLKNSSLNEATKTKLTRLAVQLINDAFVEKDLALMTVESGLRNWYRGYDSIRLALKSEEISGTPRTVSWEVISFASSGSISTVGFKDGFDKERFPLYSKQKVIINLPKEIQYVENATITLRIEHDTETTENIMFRYDNLDLSKREPLEIVMPVKRCGRVCVITFDRRMDENYYKRWKLKRMTGMKVSWHYNTSVQSQSYYKKRNENLIRMANIIHEIDTDDIENIWEDIKEIKSNWCLEIGIYDFERNDKALGSLIRSTRISNYLNHLGATLNLSNISSEPIHDQISEETLRTASDMFLYLSAYPDYKWLGRP